MKCRNTYAPAAHFRAEFGTPLSESITREASPILYDFCVNGKNRQNEFLFGGRARLAAVVLASVKSLKFLGQSGTSGQPLVVVSGLGS